MSAFFAPRSVADDTKKEIIKMEDMLNKLPPTEMNVRAKSILTQTRENIDEVMNPEAPQVTSFKL